MSVKKLLKEKESAIIVCSKPSGFGKMIVFNGGENVEFCPPSPRNLDLFIDGFDENYSWCGRNMIDIGGDEYLESLNVVAYRDGGEIVVQDKDLWEGVKTFFEGQKKRAELLKKPPKVDKVNEESGGKS